jgi:hypothetical protein
MARHGALDRHGDRVSAARAPRRPGGAERETSSQVREDAMVMKDQMIQSSSRLEPVPHGEVQDLLSQVARAVTSGDGNQIATLWEVPGIIVAGDAVTAISSRAQLEAMFGAAKAQYNQRGIFDTRADIVEEDWVGDRLVVAKVRWPYLDASGREVGGEASDYTLRRDPSGRLRICAVLMRGIPTHR